MRKCIIFNIFFLGALCTYAQQLPHFTNFTYNYLQYNPAVTGATPCLDLKIGARRQWTSLEGAPNSGFASVHGKIKKKKFNFHGLGAVIENDKFGPFGYTGVNLNYAYHMRMKKGYMLSSGMGIGFKQFRVNFADMDLEQQDVDPVITAAVNDFVFPVINFGLWLYKNDRFFGISARQINPTQVEGINTGLLQTHWTFAYGYSRKMSDNIFFKPAFLLNYVAQSRPSLEAQGLLSYKDRVAFGLAGRTGNGLSAMLRVDFLGFLTAAYAYDLTLSKMRFDGGPTHEIILGIRSCGKSDELHTRCAAYD